MTRFGSQTDTRRGLSFWLKSWVAQQRRWYGWCVMLWLPKVAEWVVMRDPMLKETRSTQSISMFNIFWGCRKNNNTVFFPCFVLTFWFIYQTACVQEPVGSGLRAVDSWGLAFIISLCPGRSLVSVIASESWLHLIKCRCSRTVKQSWVLHSVNGQNQLLFGYHVSHPKIDTCIWSDTFSSIGQKLDFRMAQT